jgi:hypothetical protein
MAPPDPDPFAGLVLDDAFVASARLTEPTTAQRLRGRRVRRVRPRARTAARTAPVIGMVIGMALALALWSLTGLGGRGSGQPGTALPSAGTTGSAVSGSGVSGSGVSGSGDQLPVPEPWNDPVTELDVQVGPDWLAIGPPSGP